MNKNELFDENNFSDFLNITEKFYRPYFKSKKDMDQFISMVMNHPDNTYLCMINQIRRFITLCNKIDTIYSGCDSLRVTFFRMLLEAICSLSQYEKDKDSYEKICKCMSVEGEQYILNHFIFCDVYKILINDVDKDKVIADESQYTLTINDFFVIMAEIRNDIVHEGAYWDAPFFSAENKAVNVHITTKKSIKNLKKLIESTEQLKAEEAFYYTFISSLSYDKFVFYLVEGLVNFILFEMKKNCAGR